MSHLNICCTASHTASGFFDVVLLLLTPQAVDVWSTKVQHTENAVDSIASSARKLLSIVTIVREGNYVVTCVEPRV
jgi:hypothetical protein